MTLGSISMHIQLAENGILPSPRLLGVIVQTAERIRAERNSLNCGDDEKPAGIEPWDFAPDAE